MESQIRQIWLYVIFGKSIKGKIFVLLAKFNKVSHWLVLIIFNRYFFKFGKFDYYSALKLSKIFSHNYMQTLLLDSILHLTFSSFLTYFAISIKLDNIVIDNIFSPIKGPYNKDMKEKCHQKFKMSSRFLLANRLTNHWIRNVLKVCNLMYIVKICQSHDC